MGLRCVFVGNTAERISELQCALLLLQVVPCGPLTGHPQLPQAPGEGRQSPTLPSPQQGLACARARGGALCSPAWAKDEKAGLTSA